MRRKYLGERAREDETGGTKSQQPLFNKIKYIIGSSRKARGLSNAVDSGEKSKKRGSQKEEKEPFDLNNEPPSPSPSDSSNDTFKYNDSSEEGEDNLGNKHLGVSNTNKIKF
jgi:hypothetical protein